MSTSEKTGRENAGATSGTIPPKRLRDKVSIIEDLEALAATKGIKPADKLKCLSQLARVQGFIGRSLGDVSNMSDDVLERTFVETCLELSDLVELEDEAAGEEGGGAPSDPGGEA